MSDNIWKIWRYLTISDNFLLYLTIFDNISLYPITVYQLILLQRNFQTGVGFSTTKTHLSWNLYFRQVQGYFSKFNLRLGGSINFQTGAGFIFEKPAPLWKFLWSRINWYIQWLNIVRYCQKLSDIVRYFQILSHIDSYC